MDFFGIGWLELFFILILVLLVAGPKDLERGAKGLGRLINRLNRSPGYQAIRKVSNELRTLPQRLAREANLEELKELTQEVQQVKQDVQQVKEEIRENTNTIASTPQAFRAWVQSLPPNDPPAAQAPAAPPPANGPQAAADPTPAKDV